MDPILSYMHDINFTENVRTPASECPTSFDILPVMMSNLNIISEPMIHSLQDFNSISEQRDPDDEASILLSQCVHRDKRTYEKAEQALFLIREFKLTKFDLLCRGLVHFPILLKEFLEIQKEVGASISSNDLASMFCRCIEHQPDDTFAQTSMQYLIEFKGDLQLEIKLLPGKYNIDAWSS